VFENTLAERMRPLAGESAFQVLAAANALEARGMKVIHFEIGEPDFPTPQHIVEAGKAALDSGQTRYCNAQGLPALREAIVEYTRAYKGVDAKPSEVVVASGGKPIIFFTICALVNPGDEVIYPNPGFPTYESVIGYVGGVPVPVVLKDENQFRLGVDELTSKISPRTKLLVLNSPSNPTGSLLEEEDLKVVAAAATRRGITVLSDEVYSRIVFGESTPCIATLPGMKERTVILDGFSKTYCMTGWRLGYGIMHEELAEKVTRLIVNAASCTPPFIQSAGIAALKGPQNSVDAMVAEFAQRRRFIVDALNEMPGVSCQSPRGAFYAYPRVSVDGLTSRDIARFLLNSAGVALLDGAAFGRAGDGYLRISFATSMPLIEEGIKRIGMALAALRDDPKRAFSGS